MDSEDILNKRTDKIINWIKDPYNLTFTAIIIFTIVIRLYYFVLTKNQPLWWDEAEYFAKAKSIILGTPVWIAPIREVIVPYFWSLLYFLYPGEILARLFQVVISTITVVFVYFIGKKLFDKRIALIGMLLMAVDSTHLFFTARLLVYPWAPLIYVLAIFFFLKRDEKNIYLYFSAAIIALGIVTYFSSAFLLIFLLIFLLTIEKKEFFKKKRNYVSLMILILVMLPFVVYYMINIGAPLPRFSQVTQSLGNASGGNILSFNNWFDYFIMLPRLLLNPLIYIFSFGSILLLFKILLGLDLLWKNKNNSLKKYYFVLLWVFIILGIYSIIYIIGGDIAYDGFILPIFPGIFLICSITIIWLYDILKKYNKILAIIVVLLILVFSIHSQLTYSDSMIKNKIESFDAVKEAGLWIKENSVEDAIIISQSRPQITYYAERKTYSIANSSENIIKQFNELKPTFFIDSIYEPVGDYVHEFPKKYKNKLIPTKVYFLDKEKQQPSLIIYSVNGSNF